MVGLVLFDDRRHFGVPTDGDLAVRHFQAALFQTTLVGKVDLLRLLELI